MKRLLCLFGFHDWRVTRRLGDCALWMTFRLAGVDADCTRCGKHWRDFEDHALAHGWQLKDLKTRDGRVAQPETMP